MAALLLAALAAAGAARADIAIANYGGILGYFNMTVENGPARAETSYDFASGVGVFAISYHAEADALALPVALDAAGAGLVTARAEVSGNTIIQALSSAALTFAFIVRDYRQPPFLPDFIPIDANYTYSGSSLPGSSAAVSLSIGGVDVLDGPFPTEFSVQDKVRINVSPNFAVTIAKSVGCVATNPLAVYDSPSSSSCRVSLDPIFSFNQDAFDATWGTASFRLSDYFAMSPSAPVDEPAAALLLGLGLLGLLASGPRRRAEARYPVNDRA